MGKLFVIILLLIPIVTFANDLKLSNDTKYTLSFYTTRKCSEEFGDLAARTIKVLPEEKFKQACKYSKHNCEVAVYDASHCEGKETGIIMFDVDQGVRNITVFGKEITIKGNGFNLFFEDK